MSALVGPTVNRQQLLSNGGKSLMFYDYEPKIQQYVRKWERDVPNGSDPWAQRFGDIFVEVKNEKNFKDSRQTISTIITGSNEVGTFVSRPNVVNEAALDVLMQFVKKITKTTQIVAAGTQPDDITFGLIRSEVRYFDSVHAEKENWVVEDDQWITLTKESVDEETRFPVTTTREIVAIGTSAVQVAGTDQTVNKLDEAHMLRESEALSGYNTPYVQYDEIRYSFANLLTSLIIESAFITPQGRTFVRVNSVIKRGDVKVVPVKQTVSFTSTEQAPPTLFSFTHQDLRYEGILFDVDVRDVLFDAGTLLATTGGSDTFWGSVAESFTWAGTTPVTYTQYTNLIGTIASISHSSKKWKYNLFRNILSQVTLE